MLHGHIVDMIDACLERLHMARRLLTPSHDTLPIEDLLEISARTTAEAKKKVRPAIRIKKTRKDELTASLFEQTHAVEAIPPVTSPLESTLETRPVHAPAVIVARPELRVQVIPAPARRESAPRPKKIAFPTGALASPAPAGPVVVSASQVSKESAEKRAVVEAKRTPPSQSAAAPLTAEMLAKRWLQGAQA